jgi:hypothetical protein
MTNVVLGGMSGLRFRKVPLMAEPEGFEPSIGLYKPITV